MASLNPAFEKKGHPYFYQDSVNRWRWRITARNGKQIAEGSEGDGWATRAKAVTNYKATRKAIANATTGIDSKGRTITL